MSLSPKLLIRQSQSLVMTPQLMQAIRLLQLSHLDLATYVANELETNPLLERADDDHRPESPVDEAPWTPDNEPSRADMEARLGTELGNVFPDDPVTAPVPAAPVDAGDPGQWSVGGSSVSGSGDAAADLEAYVASATTLSDHLEQQLSVAITDPRQRLIGIGLIGMIEDSGYITEPLDTLAEQLGAPLAEIEKVLAVIQTFDPPGVGARSLKECLAIQLRERDRLDPIMQTFLDNIELLARHDLAALRKICGVDAEDLADMIAEVRSLTPKPGYAYGSAPVQTVVPDVYVRPGPDGSWRVDLNPETLPRVLVNQTYHATVSKTARSAEERAYIAERLQSANWLTRSLEQRARTILKVASEIVRQQDAFLVHGVEHLRPINLKSIAEAIEMHESTVSRVTSNKYLATPRGVFEMKFFFTSAIGSSTGGDAHSAESVRHRIRQMIDAESASDILSDDTIVERLRESGIDIARRTVAKYREAMGIPSSVERRRAKRAKAQTQLHPQTG